MTDTEHLTDPILKEVEQHPISSGSTVGLVPPGVAGEVGARPDDSPPSPASTNEHHPSPCDEPPGAYIDRDLTPPVADEVALAVRESVLTPGPQTSIRTTINAAAAVTYIRRIAVATASLLVAPVRNQPGESLSVAQVEDQANTPQAQAPAPAIVGPSSSVAQNGGSPHSTSPSSVDGPNSTLPMPQNSVIREDRAQDPTIIGSCSLVLKLEVPASSALVADSQTPAMIEASKSVHGPAPTAEGQTSGGDGEPEPVAQEAPAQTQQAQDRVGEVCSLAPKEEAPESPGPAPGAEAQAYRTPGPSSDMDQETSALSTPANIAEQPSATPESENDIDQEACASSTLAPTAPVQTSGMPESLNTAEQEASASSAPVPTIPVQPEVPESLDATDQEVSASTPALSTQPESLTTMEKEASTSSTPAVTGQVQTFGAPESLNVMDQEASRYSTAPATQVRTLQTPESLKTLDQEAPASSPPTPTAQLPTSETPELAVEQQAPLSSTPAPTAQVQAPQTPESWKQVDQEAPMSSTPAPTALDQTSQTPEFLKTVDSEEASTSSSPPPTAEDQISETFDSPTTVDQEPSASSPPTTATQGRRSQMSESTSIVIQATSASSPPDPAAQVQTSQTPESSKTVDWEVLTPSTLAQHTLSNPEQEASALSAPTPTAQGQTSEAHEILKTSDQEASIFSPSACSQDQSTETPESREKEAHESSTPPSSAQDQTTGLSEHSNATDKRALPSSGEPLNIVNQEATASSDPFPTAEGLTSGNLGSQNFAGKQATASNSQRFGLADPFFETHHAGSTQPRARIAESPQPPHAGIKPSTASASTTHTQARVRSKLPALQNEHSHPTVQLQTTTAAGSSSSIDQSDQGHKSKSKHESSKKERRSKFRGQFNTTDIILLVTGSVGSGRSTFINAFFPPEAPPMAVGEDWSIAVCTKKIEHAELPLGGPSNCRLVLVDTPGFNNYDKPDAEVVQDILNWLGEHFHTSEKYRAGVIYLHDLTEPRYQGVGGLDLKLVDSIRKRNQLQQLLMVTTKWNRIDEADGNRQHSLLKARWAGLLQSGATLEKYKEAADAWRIVGDFLPTLDSNKVDIRKLVAEITRHRPPWSVKGIWSTVVGSKSMRK